MAMLLLIDDDQSLTELLAVYFEELGHSVHIAQNGDVRRFGAICDGEAHPLSSRYANLASWPCSRRPSCTMSARERWDEETDPYLRSPCSCPGFVSHCSNDTCRTHGDPCQQEAQVQRRRLGRISLREELDRLRLPRLDDFEIGRREAGDRRSFLGCRVRHGGPAWLTRVFALSRSEMLALFLRVEETRSVTFL